MIVRNFSETPNLYPIMALKFNQNYCGNIVWRAHPRPKEQFCLASSIRALPWSARLVYVCYVVQGLESASERGRTV